MKEHLTFLTGNSDAVPRIPSPVGDKPTDEPENVIELDESAPNPPRFDEPSVKLESRGTTQQFHQSLLWSKHTIHKNTTAAKLRTCGRGTEAAKLEQCHTIYTFAQCQGCRSVQKFPNRCDLFYCAECQPRLSADRKKAVEWWTREIRQPKHVVLTLKNTVDLSKGHVLEAKKWLTNLRRSKFARNWTGGFYSIETTNEGNGWHLHFHLLIDAGWIDAIELSRQWARATNGMGRIVKVKDARGTNYLAEVTKYAVKGVQLAAWTGTQIEIFIDAFTGVRTFGVFGSLYGARTRFYEFWKAVRGSAPTCKCGCCSVRYFSESEFLELDLKPTIESSTLPPPVMDSRQLSLLNVPSNFVAAFK